MNMTKELSQKGIYTFVISFILFSFLALTLIIYVDPLWLNTNDNFLNRNQPVYNERLTKTLRLTYGVKAEDYDSISIGSSRSAFLPVDYFKNYRVFNYSVSSVYPEEYIKMLNFYSEKMNKPKAIIIGADFFGTRNDWADFISEYIKDSQSKTYVVSQLFSIDTLLLALSIGWNNLTEDTPQYGNGSYDRYLRKTLYRKAEHDPRYKPLMRKYCRYFYGDTYIYYWRLPDIYTEIVERYPDTQFIVFTTPITGDLYDAMIHKGLLENYLRWITLMVNKFGMIVDLMGHNEFTDNPDNYYDYHHFSSEAGRYIVEDVLEKEQPTFGARITHDNLEQYLVEKRAEAELILNHNENPCVKAEQG